MYLSQSEFTARSGELKRLTANLQSVPERILQVLSTFGREMEAIYRLESDLKAEAIRTRLLDAQQRALPLCFWTREDPKQPSLF